MVVVTGEEIWMEGNDSMTTSQGSSWAKERIIKEGSVLALN